MPYILGEAPLSASNGVGSTSTTITKGKLPDAASTSFKALGDQKSTANIELCDANDEANANIYPTAKLDIDKITDAIAGKLAISLLGHILFLKNQVPFPVSQLGRIPNGKTNTRALKQRTELLTSYDTISSHLETTFSALSTALARSPYQTRRGVAQAYLAFLVGPSIGTAKSKLILGIDGLETRVWGSQNDVPTRKNSHDEGGESDSEEEYEERGEEPEESEDEELENEDSQEEESDGDGSEQYPESAHSLSPLPYISYAEQQKFLQKADRLLSRTLAAADVDADGVGISSEMSPTQTHILIRAPRRFVHPAWIPRQNVTASLDDALEEFLVGSGIDFETPRKQSKKQRVEGVWITSRTGIQTRLLHTRDSKLKSTGQSEEEEDMIWWSWDGKLIGFSDW